MKKIDWNSVEEAGEFERLPPGGYICRIVTATDFSDKEYLKIEYDIADGKYKGYYRDASPRIGFWSGNFIKSYKETAQGFFKSFLTAVEESNQGYKFNDDESTLRGKFIGLVLGEEEYRKKDGSVGTRLYAAQTRSVYTIRDGDFTVPDKKLLPVGQQAPGSKFNDDYDDGPLPWD